MLVNILIGLAVRYLPQRMDFDFDLWQEQLVDYVPAEPDYLSGYEIVGSLRNGFDIGLKPDHVEPR